MHDSGERGGNNWLQEVSPPAETYIQRILREGFAQAYFLNAQALATFDPTDFSMGPVDIRLTSDFLEADQAEPTLAAHYRNAMLTQLGLPLTPLEEGDPRCLFQETYNDKTHKQLQRIVRNDGVQIVLYTAVGGEGQQTMQLLPNAAAEKMRRELQDAKDRWPTVRALAQLFVTDAATLKEELSAVPLATMRGMLEELTWIRQTGIVTIPGHKGPPRQPASKINLTVGTRNDRKELVRARKLLVEATAPAVPWLKKRRARQLAERLVRYDALLENTLLQLELGVPDAAREYALNAEQEQLRLQMDRQYALQRRLSVVTRIGASAAIMKVLRHKRSR